MLARFEASWSDLRGSCLDRDGRALGLGRGRDHDLGRWAWCLRMVELEGGLDSVRRRGSQPSDEACQLVTDRIAECLAASCAQALTGMLR